MKTTSILRLVLAGFLITAFHLGPAICAQNEYESETDVKQARLKILTDACVKLKDALGTKPDRLSVASQPFLDAAKDPSDMANLKRATEGLSRALKESQKDPKFQAKDRVAAVNEAIRASESYQETAKSKGTPTGTPTPKLTPEDPYSGSSWTSLIWPIAGGVAGAALIILAIFGAMRWRAGFWAKLDGHMNDIVEAHVKGVKKRQDEFGKHLAALGDEQTKTSDRLELIGVEVQALSRRLRQGTFDSGFDPGAGRQGLSDYGRQEVKPVEPEFPASADEYLNKMKGSTLVVKPDFQNGILVNDADGKGELVLIRNASVPDDAQPLFVVPRVTQFQTKQEFHSYYERYYECQRPSAGDVWIIDPAIVSTVPGGWQLREKGVLEVR